MLVHIFIIHVDHVYREYLQLYSQYILYNCKTNFINKLQQIPKEKLNNVPIK